MSDQIKITPVGVIFVTDQFKKLWAGLETGWPGHAYITAAIGGSNQVIVGCIRM
jgi:hypothetical protein